MFLFIKFLILSLLIFILSCTRFEMESDRLFGTNFVDNSILCPSFMILDEYQDVDGDGIVDHRRIGRSQWEEIDVNDNQ